VIKHYKMHLLWHLLLNYINLLVWFFCFLAIVFSIISFGFEFLLVKGTESCLACHTNLSKQGHQVSCGCQLFFCTPPTFFILVVGWVWMLLGCVCNYVGGLHFRFPGYLCTSNWWNLCHKLLTCYLWFGQGRIQTKLAQEADKKASQDIFKARSVHEMIRYFSNSTFIVVYRPWFASILQKQGHNKCHNNWLAWATCQTSNEGFETPSSIWNLCAL
jgi:hypothetical protein